MELLGFLLVAAMPSVMITGVLVPIISNRGRPAMWKAAVILMALPIAWAIWTNPHVPVFILLLLPILVIAGVLHYANGDDWSMKAAGTLAVCAGTASFALVMYWMLQHVVMGAY